MNWTKENDDKLMEYRQTYSQKETARLLTEDFGKKFTRNAVKNRERRIKDRDQWQSVQMNYTEAREILPDGSHKSDKLLRMSEEQSKDKNYILKAHGYDIDEWELVSARSKIWNVYSKQDNVQTLYSSQITVKPRTNEFDIDRLEKILSKIKPVKPIPFKGELTEEKTYLNIPLFDLHFGNSTLEHYQGTIQSILNLLQHSYHEVLFIIGQDLLHNDNFKGQTANGTQIDKVNMEKAWDEADTFYITLIDQALKASAKVKVIYSKGNHDESMAWSFVKGLEKYYRLDDRITFDTRFKERKAHMLGANFIGTTHGDKNRNNAASNFSVEFPEMWARATTREVYMGHLHKKRVTKKPIEIVNDADGLIIRELGTGNAIDGYHDDHGYTLAHKEFEVFEYGESKKKHIHYV